MTDVAEIKDQLLAEIAAAADERQLEAVRVAALGKKGRVTQLMKGLGGMDPDQRKAAGPALNALKDAVARAIEARRQVLRDAAVEERLARERVDVTLPVRPERRGTVHPVSQVYE